MKQFKHLLTAVLSFFICMTVVFPQTISGEENDILYTSTGKKVRVKKAEIEKT